MTPTSPADKPLHSPERPRADWLATQATEVIMEPGLPIVDPHHHLWDRGGHITCSMSC